MIQKAEQILIQYLGQSGFLFKKNDLTVLIDPYLSDSVDRATSNSKEKWKRNYAPPFSPGELKEVDLVLCTHDHMDHADIETLKGIAEASSQSIFAGPLATKNVFREAGIADSRIVVLNSGSPYSFKNLKVIPIGAAHEEYVVDDQGFFRYLGYILEWDGATLFHAGDTIVTQQLYQELSEFTIDVGFLPINGRDEKRHLQGIEGNMSAEEAVGLATMLAAGNGFGLLVPIHYDLYSSNGADVNEFVKIWEKAFEPKPEYKTFSPGESIFYLLD